MQNGNGESKDGWHIGPVQIGYTMLGFRYAIPRKALNCIDIMGAVASQYGLNIAEILGNRRAAKVARPRQMAMLIAREALPNLSLPQIARRFCRDHTTVMHGIKTARSRLEWDGDYLDGYLAACEALGIHTAPQAIESHTKACLRCGEDFLSEGPHHRMCDNRSCREARDKQSSAIDWEPFGAQWS